MDIIFFCTCVHRLYDYSGRTAVLQFWHKRMSLGCHLKFSADYHMESFARDPAKAQNLIIFWLICNLWISQKLEDFSTRVKIFWDEQVHQESHKIRYLLKNCTSRKYLFSARSYMQNRHWRFPKVIYLLKTFQQIEETSGYYFL